MTPGGKPNRRGDRSGARVRRSSAGAIAWGMLWLLATPARPVHACGGFFCSQNGPSVPGNSGPTAPVYANPVSQTAERIVFVKHDDGTITAVIQILYEGPARNFAWLLPVPGVPQVAVSSGAVLDALQVATNPTYQLVSTSPNCGGGSYSGYDGYDGYGGGGGGRGGGACCGLCGGAAGTDGALGAMSPGNASGGVAGAGSGPPVPEMPPQPVVTVEAAASIGPYDYTVISVQDVMRTDEDAGIPDPTEVAVQWLTDNGYDVGESGDDVLRPYLADGLNILAVRLTKGNLVGAIRPLRITYAGNSPSIPIRPTAVAANDDMGVLVWLLSDARAVPLNYKSVELNEVLVDWFNPGPAYTDLVSRAADEGSGQAFLTEYAGPMVPGPSGPGWETLLQTSQAASPEAAIAQADGVCPAWWPGMAPCSTWDGWDEALAGAVTLPRGTTVDDLQVCLALPANAGPEAAACEGLTLERVQFDTSRFLAGFADLVIRPVVETWLLFASRPSLTRLFTTLSPAEMTVDPVFGFNRDLAPTTNLHQIVRDVACDATWTLVFPTGVTVRATFGGTPETWPVDSSALPAALRIVQYGTTGPGVVLEDHTPELTGKTFGTLSCHHVSPDPSGGKKGGCSVVAGQHDAGGAVAMFAFVLFAAVLVTTRRGKRRPHSMNRSPSRRVDK